MASSSALEAALYRTTKELVTEHAFKVRFYLIKNFFKLILM